MNLQIFLILLAAVFAAVRAIAILEKNEVGDVNEEEIIDNQKCPKWGKWENSKCLWPSQNFSSLPKSCTELPKKPKIQGVVKSFIQSKQIEIYSAVQGLFKLRGAKSACGYCSRKIRCRQRENGEWKKGCSFIQAQIVNEECAGTKPCEINAILGACPPPVPNPIIRRRPKPGPRAFDLENSPEMNFIQQTLDQIEKIGNTDENVAGEDLESDVGKNKTQGPPLWHCVRASKNANKCLCCCGWYLPNAKTGKCVSIQPKDINDAEIDQSVDPNWSGLMNFDDSEDPFDLTKYGNENSKSKSNDESLVEQLQSPLVENEIIENSDQELEIDQNADGDSDSDLDQPSESDQSDSGPIQPIPMQAEKPESVVDRIPEVPPKIKVQEKVEKPRENNEI